MNIKNILICLEPRNPVELIAQFTINLAQTYDARLFALVIIKQPSPDIKTRTDERAWKRLYEIEEDAFEAGVRISLLLEEIDDLNRTAITDKIISIIKHFSIGMLVVSANAKINIKDLTSGLAIPVIVFPQPEKITTNGAN
jgi:hypothetical protein